jgi:chemotaxis protein methyltransferase CheR
MISTAPLHQSAGERDALEIQSDFEFKARDFEWLRRAASQYSGIVLPETKGRMVYSRLAKRLRQLGLTKFSEYRAILESGDQAEFVEFINALTTNLTYFFREPHHFEHLRNIALPGLIATRRPARRVSFWSAGCSTGEEPYSISLVAKQTLAELGGGWDYRILATDLDTKVLAQAAAGVYEQERVDGLDLQTLQAAFLRGAGSFRGQVRVKPELQTPIAFQQLNLVQEWFRPDPVDIIFCRNVVIYFDRPTQKRLFDRFADSIVPGGYLYIGHSETLFQTTDRFVLAGKTIYRRIA